MPAFSMKMLIEEGGTLAKWRQGIIVTGFCIKEQ
jgi:hypothetical protein